MTPEDIRKSIQYYIFVYKEDIRVRYDKYLKLNCIPSYNLQKKR